MKIISSPNFPFLTKVWPDESFITSFKFEHEKVSDKRRDGEFIYSNDQTLRKVKSFCRIVNSWIMISCKAVTASTLH